MLNRWITIKQQVFSFFTGPGLLDGDMKFDATKSRKGYSEASMTLKPQLRLGNVVPSDLFGCSGGVLGTIYFRWAYYIYIMISCFHGTN